MRALLLFASLTVTSWFEVRALSKRSYCYEPANTLLRYLDRGPCCHLLAVLGRKPHRASPRSHTPADLLLDNYDRHEATGCHQWKNGVGLSGHQADPRLCGHALRRVGHVRQHRRNHFRNVVRWQLPRLLPGRDLCLWRLRLHATGDGHPDLL